MDRDLRRVYIDEIMHRCDICHAALADLNRIAAEDPILSDPFRVALEAIHHAATISKLLWPPVSKSKAASEIATSRGSYLRKVLEIGDQHPIRDRTLRNHLEHYDERLDQWAESARGHHVAHQLIGPLAASESEGALFVVQHFDPRTKTLAFRGQRFHLEQLDAAVMDIYRRAKKVRFSRVLDP